MWSLGLVRKPAWKNPRMRGIWLANIISGINEARVDATGIAKSSYGDPTRLVPAHKDPELFTVVQNALGIPDPEEQMAALQKMYQRLREEQYYLGIGFVNIPWAVGPRVVSWEPRPLSLFPNNLHNLILE